MLVTLIVACGTIGMMPFALPHAHTAPVAVGKRMLHDFNYSGVSLDEGPLRRQFDETRDYYLRIPNDDLLKGFRERAGLPAPGMELGGWYSDDTFHVFGQILSGLARMYAASGDPDCRDKANALMTEWAKCIAPDGFFFYSKKPNAPHYIYDKMVGGLVDMYLYIGNRDALRHLKTITGWAVKNLGRERPYGGDSNEWYTLSENLYRAFLATRDRQYRNFGEVWEYTEYWSRYAEHKNIFLPAPNGRPITGYHAYSHVNTLGGAGEAYLVKHDDKYLDTIRNAYDYLTTQQCFATGGFGPDETICPLPELLRRLDNTRSTFETQCGTWAVLKLCKHLITLTGDARYGDWIEKVVINGIGASIPMSADGKVFYYSDYNPHGGMKSNIGFGWSCCTGTRPMAVADFYDVVYFRDDQGVYVNLYAPSTVHWAHENRKAIVVQRTRFPEINTSSFTISVNEPTTMQIGFRVPAWLSGPMTIKVNGRSVKTEVGKRHWALVKRHWRNGDRIDVMLPMHLSVSRFADQKTGPFALMMGPVALAARSVKKNPAREIAKATMPADLVPAEGEPLAWHLKFDPAILIRPFYAYKEGEKYYLYLDPSAADRVPCRDITFTGIWNDSGVFRFSDQVGATAEYAFEGTGIRWLGYCFDDAGHAEVRIDGEVAATADQYGPGRQLDFEWSKTGLPMGKHTIRISLLDEKNSASKGRYLNIAGFEIIGTQ